MPNPQEYEQQGPDPDELRVKALMESAAPLKQQASGGQGEGLMGGLACAARRALWRGRPLRVEETSTT